MNEDVDLKVGELLQLQILPDVSGKRYQSKLIGCLKGRSLMMLTPKINNTYFPLKEGQQCLARMMVDYTCLWIFFKNSAGLQLSLSLFSREIPQRHC
ncbi:MAG: flagellar brake protein [Methylococcales bacterium]|nr:flagellar brake protein [Methylococcales bacterium]